MEPQIPRARAHEEFNPHFFTDYVLFSGTFRHYVAKSLQDILRGDPNDVHRRFFVVGVYREEYAAYEDVGVVLTAFLRFRRGELKFPIEGILRYKPEKVILENLFVRNAIKSPEELYEALGLSTWIPADWQSVYPSIDCPKTLMRMCRFMFIDCQANQRRHGIDAYNRIKHGLAFVPNGQRYLNGFPNAPGILISNPRPRAANPYALLGLPMDDRNLDERARVVEFIQSTLRALVSFYLIANHADFLRDNHGINPAARIFNLRPLISVREFMEQLSARPDLSQSNVTT